MISRQIGCGTGSSGRVSPTLELLPLSPPLLRHGLAIAHAYGSGATKGLMDLTRLSVLRGGGGDGVQRRKNVAWPDTSGSRVCVFNLKCGTHRHCGRT